jgi:hypothetical protein
MLPEVVAVIEKAHPQVRAVVNRFALYVAALRMAIEAGLLPWSVVQADSGIVACMSRWAISILQARLCVLPAGSRPILLLD